MANIADAFSLDATGPTSNSNYGGANIAESCAPSGLNNALRQLGSFLAQATSYQSPSISASVSTNIAASGSGFYQSIVGVGPVNSFGTVPGQQPSASPFRILHFATSTSLSNGPSLILLGSASRRTQPGDVGAYVHEGSSDVWREWLFSRADGSPLNSASISATTITAASISASGYSGNSMSVSAATFTRITGAASISASIGSFTGLNVGGRGLVVQNELTATVSYASLGSTAIPKDDTVPTSSEGNAIADLDTAYTPASASSRLRLVYSLNLQYASEQYVIAALFIDADAAATQTLFSFQRNGGTTTFVFDVPANSTSARTYKLRIGCSTAIAIYLNGDSGGRNFGGTCASHLYIQEYLP
jgi:hypothetical protein